MTDEPRDEFGEALRRALHAEAAQVVPSPDGLERIRSGIEKRSRRRFAFGSLPDWFTTNLGRPMVAVAATAFIVVLGVSAPQAIAMIAAATGVGHPDKGDDRQAAATRQTSPGASSTNPQGQPQPGAPRTSPSSPPSSAATTRPQGVPSCAPEAKEPPPATASTPLPTPVPAPSSCPPPAPAQPPEKPGPGEPTDTDPTTPEPEDPVTEEPTEQTSEPTAEPEAVTTP
jgi:hypothetical protein